MPITFPLRTPPFDDQGNWTRPMIDFFQQVAAAGGGGAPAGSNSGTIVTIDVAGGVATPDLSAGTRFLLILTQDTMLALPANATTTPIDWLLIVQQDSTGKHSLDTSAYPINYSLATQDSPANTESIQGFTTDASGTRGSALPLINQPIP